TVSSGFTPISTPSTTLSTLLRQQRYSPNLSNHFQRYISSSPRSSASAAASPQRLANYGGTRPDPRAEKSETIAYYVASVIVAFIGLSYAAVPLYRVICTQTGLDGTPLTSPGHKFDPSSMKPVEGARPVKITFQASTSDSMKWKFTPVTREVRVVPGETALAFYMAENPTDEDIVGISTYSVVPAKAAQYFNKIQCFCFEEQMLAAREEVDMPVFFYIDPEFADDPWMRDVREITLHYTFFKSKHQRLGAAWGDQETNGTAVQA
ncbi:Cytochrome c oxidase assembly protein cox11, mitochondrial, partial [Quaeritorhiza haematococci]